MNNNDVINKKKGNGCLIAVGWILIFAAAMVFLAGLVDYTSCQAEKDNYEEVYVYSDNGLLYYELNNDIIYVTNTYDDYGESVEANIPSKRTVIMYCEKDNLTSCLYINSNDSTYSNMQSPILSIIISLVLVAFGVMFILNKKSSHSFSATYLIFVLLFALGLYCTGFELYHAFNYFNLKNNGVLTTATIYSEIYKEGTSSSKYKPVAYYYVDGKKYIYVSDSFIDGSLEGSIGTTFEIYYNESNPSKTSKADSPVNFLILFIGIVFAACTFPFVFNIKIMDKRLNNAMQNNQSKEWKI